MFDVNVKVIWTSASGGFSKTKQGMIVAVVPPGRDPKDFIPTGYSFKNHRSPRPRAYVSYLVRVEGTKKLYWPVVSDLKAILYEAKATALPPVNPRNVAAPAPVENKA